MNILITGATGFIGKKLLQALLHEGHRLSIVTRNTSKAQKTIFPISKEIAIIAWEDLHEKKLEDIECVINLAGASIATFPWNTKNKKRIYDSRIRTTQKLVASLPVSCTTFISASAIGYYPSHAEKLYQSSYTNTSPDSFLEKVCVDRESEATKAQSPRRRVVRLRSGLVIGEEKIGHMMKKATKLFGGVIMGSGNQWMSLITVDQRVEYCLTVVNDTAITGPVNMVSQHRQYKNYIQDLAKKMQRPVWWLKVPSFFLKLVLGEMSVLILGSQRVALFSHDEQRVINASRAME